MDSKILKGALLAYREVYNQDLREEVQEVVDEGKLPLDKERRDRIGRQIGRRTYSSSPKKYDQMDKMSGALKAAQKKQNNEELDVFDTVLEYLQTEGYENPEQMMTQLSSEEIDAILEATYSAKAARAGKDIGKPGKAFAKIAASAAKRYGSKERGEKVAGAVLAKLRKEEIELLEDAMQLDELSNRKLRAYVKKSDKSHQDLNKKWDQGTATYKDKYKSINRERGQERALDILDKRSGK